ncbi:MAG: tRNA (adenosine(37)-N6)-threonylcarbamoyltransferase complex ATPase subunit type 1 TsaE [Coriobacteriaceae bacterium]|nr:tRNA (adenosine(37)-N6)-threonylcarbamoyltransferase complex ATPase subunit type 1 TsaE [Coriobacteriaceae bacterium]
MTLKLVGERQFESACVEDTIAFGELVASCLDHGDVLVLSGGLGVGKTHFTKGVSSGLGDANPVTSPTFALMAVHDGGRIPLFHFDLYRLEHAYQLEDTGIFDVLGYEGACLLEWGEQFQDELTDDYLGVTLARVESDGDKRVITLEPHGARAEKLASEIESAVAGLA